MINVGSGLLKLGFIASIIFWENVLVHKYFFLQIKENNLSYPRLSKVCL